MSYKVWNEETQTAENVTKGGNFIALTRAEYEARATAGTLNANVYYCITDDEQGAQAGIYSQAETICGTWIDGKPIYRRVFSSNSQSSIDLSSNNINKLLKIDYSWTRTDSNWRYFGTDNFENSNNKNLLYYDLTTKTINFIMSGYQISDVVIILEYTKTTD